MEILTKAQKEKKVIELYEQGKTIREISKEVHMSFGDISAIIKKYTSSKEMEQEKDQGMRTSTDTQAIKLLSQGKTLVEVTIKLDIPATEAQRIYKDFLKLKGLDELYTLCENEENIPSFVRVYKIMQEKGIKEKDLADIIKYANQLEFLKQNIDTRKNSLKAYERRTDEEYSRYQEIQDKTTQSKNLLEHYKKIINNISKKLDFKETYLRVIEDSIDNIENSEDYLRVKDIVREKTTSILNDQRGLLLATIVTVTQVIKNDPNKELLIGSFGYNETPDDFCDINNLEYPLNNEKFSKYIETYYDTLLDMATRLLNKILKEVENQILHPNHFSPSFQLQSI